ncbi:MAG TPA: hypothetical protein VFG07_05560 [Thermoplasmata archaeon]|nr:hypothetical protein [Thermoplasmata archaeon]
MMRSVVLVLALAALIVVPLPSLVGAEPPRTLRMPHAPVPPHATPGGGIAAASKVLELRYGLSAARAEAISRFVASLPQDVQVKLAQQTGIVPFDSCVSGLPGSCNQWGEVAIGAGAGCAIGAAGGAGIGCVPGAIAGAVAAALGVALFGSESGNQGPDPGPLTRAVGAELGNEFNLTQLDATNTLSLFNTSQYFFLRLADSAATLQLGSTQFNAVQDMAQSTILQQLASTTWAFSQTNANILESGESYACAYFQTGQEYGSDSGRYFPDPAPNPINVNQRCTGNYTNGIATSYWIGPANGGTGTFYLLHGAPLAASCVAFGSNPCGAGAVTYTIQAWGTNRFENMTLDCYVNCYNYQDPFKGPSGVYNVTLVAPGVNPLAFLPGAMPVFTGSSFAPFVAGCRGPTVGFSWVYNTVGGTTPSYTYECGAGYAGYWKAFQTLEANAENNALAYWTYLRTLGCRGTASDSSVCGELPTPSNCLPPNVDLGALGTTQLEALWQACLFGYSDFFNSTDYRSHSVIVSQGNYTFANLSVVGYGDVYIPNATAYPGERYANLSTWAFTGQQILVMPELASVGIQVGAPFPIPVGNPVDVFLSPADRFLHLVGNGTTNSTAGCKPGSSCPVLAKPIAFDRADPFAGAAPGDAVYLTACTLAGTPSQACSVKVLNVSIGVGTVTCPTGGGATCPATSAPGAGFVLSNPFQALADWLSSVLHIPSQIAEFIVAILVVALVLIAIYLVLVAVGAFRRAGASARGSSSKGRK